MPEKSKNGKHLPLERDKSKQHSPCFFHNEQSTILIKQIEGNNSSNIKAIESSVKDKNKNKIGTKDHL